MVPERVEPEAAEQFILEEIDSVPHLEALLLLWNSRPVSWAPEQLAQRLFITPEGAIRLLNDLIRKNLISRDADAERYAYASTLRNDQLLAAVDDTYRKELVRLTQMIHSKGSPAAQDFARAFRLKKD
jgi:DNA-binding MarR family transcriptional regulator